MRLALAAAVLLAACGGLSAQDIGAVRDARNLCQYAYVHADGGIASADNRGCYCALDGVLLRNGAGDDAGTVIRCR